MKQGISRRLLMRSSFLASQNEASMSSTASSVHSDGTVSWIPVTLPSQSLSIMTLSRLLKWGSSVEE